MPLRIDLGQQYSRVLMILLCTIALPGCSFFGGSSQNFAVSSNPTGATVRINGQQIGVTPLQYQVLGEGICWLKWRNQDIRANFARPPESLVVWGLQM